MVRNDWLGSYRARGSVDQMVRGISTRLSRNGKRLLACLPVLAAHEDEVNAAFEAFFPALIEATDTIRMETIGKPSR